MGKRPDTVRTTLDLAIADQQRLTTLVDQLAASTGTLPSHRGRRAPGRADFLRAALAVLEQDTAALADIRNHVLAEHLGPHAASELAALSVEVAAAAAWLARPDAQDSARQIAAELEQLAGTVVLGEDPQRAADDLGGAAFRLARLAATDGGYEGLRPVLALANRLQLVRDAIDPEPMRRCLYCSTTIRVTNDDRLEGHVDQAGHPCEGSAT